MRRVRLLVLAALALPALASASPEPYVILVDWEEGHTLAPTTPFVALPLAASFPFDATACHPHLLLDLLYEPDELALDVDGVGEAALAYEFRAEVWHEGELVLEKRVRDSGYGTYLGTLETTGPHELRLALGWGADVAWELRLRARLATEDPACNPPL